MLLRDPERVDSPVLRLLLERAATGSRPRKRDDGNVLSLAIEGGGMRGAVTAGMCVLLEAAGLIGSFDHIYGVSAGALNGWAAAAGQSALSATHYQDAIAAHVIRRTAPLRGRPMIDLDLLFEELISAQKPLSFEALASGPDLRVLATSLETMSLRVLGDFADRDALALAVRASASLPRLGGEPPVVGGERMADGGLIEPIPFPTAVREGASHILVLRSRPSTYRKPAVSELGATLAARHDRRLVELLDARRGSYNRLAAQLQVGTPIAAATVPEPPGHPEVALEGRSAAKPGLAARRRTRFQRRPWPGAGPQPGEPIHIHQIAVPDHTSLIGRLDPDATGVTDALRHGARAMAAAILDEPIDLCFQPVVYRTAAAPASGSREREADDRQRVRIGKREVRELPLGQPRKLGVLLRSRVARRA